MTVALVTYEIDRQEQKVGMQISGKINTSSSRCDKIHYVDVDNWHINTAIARIFIDSNSTLYLWLTSVYYIAVNITVCQ